MIQVIYKEGLTVPVIICDVCNKRIEDVMKAAAVNSSIRDRLEETPTNVLHVHKGKCHDIVEAKVEEQYDGYSPGWEELSTHLYYLC